MSEQHNDGHNGEHSEIGFDLFAQEMQDVKPLKSGNDKQSSQAARSKQPTEAQLARRQAAENELNLGQQVASEHVELVDPYDVLAFKRDGVQHGVWRSLKRGDYESQARLDLLTSKRGQPLEQSKRQLAEFIQDCQQLDLRCVQVHHGRGEKTEPPALLKSYVAKWLTQITGVLAYHSAPKAQGGAAVLTVLLQKSERQKQINRERHKAR